MAYSVEELVIEDSFIAYCTQTDNNAIEKWDVYLFYHPEEIETVEEAKRVVLELKIMLKKKQHELSASEYLSDKHLSVADSETNVYTMSKHNKKKRWLWVAASVFAIIASVILVKGINESAGSSTTVESITSPKYRTSVVSRNAQIKIIWLPDSTKVTLNAGSFLGVDKNFGIQNRNVYLEGEGFFEVAKNKTLPFIVDVSRYKVKAVGTKFNIRAYKDEEESETALVEGKVQILLPGKKRDNVFKTLVGNEKFVLQANIDNEINLEEEVKVTPLAQTNLPTHAEIAWIENYIVFENEALGDLVNTLERKYDVSIEIANDEVAKYKYTGSFQNEKIEEVLMALQISYPFTYTINGDKIIINK